MARRGADSAGRGHRVVGEARGDDRDGAGKQDGASEQQRRERRAVAEHGARRPPRDAADIGREREHRRRPQHVAARGGPVGEDRRHLHADDEGGADRGGHDLRDEPRALRPADVE